MAAQEYEQYLERWEAAEQDLSAALAAEERALERFGAIQLPPHPDSLPEVHSAADPTTSIAMEVPTRSDSGESRQQGSQPLALAALLIALAVAVLAAVKLARSGGEVFFENVDDMAAALALPVMGVISMSDNVVIPQVPAPRLARQVSLVGEILLAVFAFALVAYGVQNPAALWQVFIHPLDSLSGAIRSLLD